MAKGPKTVYYCTDCGNETIKWQGRCPACGAWNTIVEHVEKPGPVKSTSKQSSSQSKTPALLSDFEADSETRISTGIGELDRVLGGGAVLGSLVLIAEPPV
jgi:DNA repair protein RadA/Sms